jgi:quinol monooxygenase YgiN
MTTPQKPQLVHINIFTPKPGMMDEFIAAQLEGLPALGDTSGSFGSRLYRAGDDSNAILVALFEDEEAHRRFMETEAFHRHRDRLRPLLESTTPAYYTLVYVRDSVTPDKALPSPTAG